MKLRKVLKHIDFIKNIKILSTDPNGNDCLFYQGAPINVPWVYAEEKLDTNKNGEAISMEVDEDGEPCMIIWLK